MKDNRKIDIIELMNGSRCGHGFGEDSNRIISVDSLTPTLRGRDYKEPIRVTIPVLTPDMTIKKQNGRRMKEDGDEMYTLTAQDRHGVAIGFVNAHDDGTCRTIKAQCHKNSVANFTRHDSLGATAVSVKVKSALSSGHEMAHGGDSINLSFPNSETRRGRVGRGVAQTLDTKCDQGVIDTIYYPKGDCQIAIRKLTPKECFRLQAVPDEMFERARFVNSDSQLYKQAGNAVTVSVVYEIAKALKKEGK